MAVKFPQQTLNVRKSEWAAFWTGVLTQRSQKKVLAAVRLLLFGVVTQSGCGRISIQEGVYK